MSHAQRRSAVWLASAVLVVTCGAGARAQSSIPRTAWGTPDLQGVWAAAFLTPLERPAGVDQLVVNEEQAQALAVTLREQWPEVEDPQLYWDDISQLARVNGEYRTSVIVDPDDGQIPLTKMGRDLMAGFVVRFLQMFDHSGQRPLMERCLENFAYPPIRPAPALIPLQIVQTRDFLIIASEGPVSIRMVHLDRRPPGEAVRSIDGFTAGHWEGDTLVGRTTHIRSGDPVRITFGGAVLLSGDSVITERFTRVSDRELIYQFTVEDDDLYTRSWTGEFSLTRHDVPIYEYACHEGNYSLPNSLRGGQAQAAEAVRN